MKNDTALSCHAEIVSEIGSPTVSPIAEGAASVKQPPLGSGRFFPNQTYHFQTLRLFSDIAYGGADTGEVLETIKVIREGDAQGWFYAWEATANRVLAFAEKTKDRLSRGNALLRAHNYLRTAEFLLPPSDPKIPENSERNVKTFYDGLDTLGVKYEIFRASYPGGGLRAAYYPGPKGTEKRPLIVVVNGFDGTLEEIYFHIVKAAYDRGYSVLTYEGPGQGEAITKQGLVFRPDWEIPNSAVLDSFLETHAKPTKIVVLGMSMGGYLAPRAAAFDARIDGVAVNDVVYDLKEFADRVYEVSINNPQALETPDLKWLVEYGNLKTGTRGVKGFVDALQDYRLAPVAAQIKQDALLLAATEDHFTPLHQAEDFAKALTNAKSVTTVVFDRASGAGEHCHLGATTLWHAVFFDWMLDKFDTEVLR